MQEMGVDTFVEMMNKKAEELVKAMLNYGAYAQQYFGINTNNLANKNIYNSANDPVLNFTNNLSSKQISGIAAKGDLEFYGLPGSKTRFLEALE